MTGRQRARRVLGVLLVGLVATGNAEESVTAPAGDWPSYRRDAGLTGFSPLRGGLQAAPVRRWGYDLGGVTRNVEQVRLLDLNGDGRPDIVAAGRATHNLKIYWNLGSE